MDKETTLLKERIKELENEISILKKDRIEISEAKELYLKFLKNFLP